MLFRSVVETRMGRRRTISLHEGEEIEFQVIPDKTLPKFTFLARMTAARRPRLGSRSDLKILMFRRKKIEIELYEIRQRRKECKSEIAVAGDKKNLLMLKIARFSHRLSLLEAVVGKIVREKDIELNWNISD